MVNAMTNFVVPLKELRHWTQLRPTMPPSFVTRCWLTLGVGAKRVILSVRSRRRRP